MVRLKLTIAYIGTNFFGWQKQRDKRTVQQCIEEVISKICEQKIIVYGASRTDSGVHALGQVAHCNIPENKAHIPWIRALNYLLPEDISIVKVEKVKNHFDARYSAKAKIYSYTIWRNWEYVLPQRRPFVWKSGEVDEDLMEKAANIFIGTHDFASFQNTGTEVKSTIRTIFDIRREKGIHEEETRWIFIGNGFLKQMIRNIMGALVAIGKKKITLEELKNIFQERDRRLAPATAPASGLCLERVIYDEDY